MAIKRVGSDFQYDEEVEEFLVTGSDFFFDDPFGRPMDMQMVHAVWDEHRDEVLEKHIAAHPGTRPWAWWKFDAPSESRRRVGGTGTPIATAGLFFGTPAAYTGYDHLDPPKFESEATYLKRLGLLQPGETITQ